MIKSNNSYSKLKQVVVGNELYLPKRIADFTFKHFYQSNLNNSVYEKLTLHDNIYTVDYAALNERNEDLDNLAKTLQDLGIIVHRPDKLSKVVPFQTPSFKSELSACSNVRDVTLVLGDKIIETPTYVQNRYFENLGLYKIYNQLFKEGGQWIRCPHTELTDKTIDLSEWNTERDYNNIPKEMVMAIDGAQFLRVNQHIIVNVNSYNHYLGYKWIESFFPELNFHMVHIADNHIDGALILLNENTFLVNPNYPNMRELLPDVFKKFNYIYPELYKDAIAINDIKALTSVGLQLASNRGMDINVLSVDEKTVVVNKDAKYVIRALKNNGFNVIEVQLRHSEIFGGGIHCSTLDLEREH